MAQFNFLNNFFPIHCYVCQYLSLATFDNKLESSKTCIFMHQTTSYKTERNKPLMWPDTSFEMSTPEIMFWQ